MKKLLLISLMAISSIAVADDFVKFEPKIGLTEADCKALNDIGAKLVGQVSVTSIHLQNTSKENQEIYKDFVLTPTFNLKKVIHELCYSVDLN